MTFVSVHLCYLGEIQFDNCTSVNITVMFVPSPFHYIACLRVIHFWILALVNKEERGGYVDVSIDVGIKIKIKVSRKASFSQ